MALSRRQFLHGAGSMAALVTSGCAAPYGSTSSYLTPILREKHHNTVFHWIDIALQQIRDQRIPPPRAAYNLAMATAAGFLAANAVERRYEDNFGIGQGPRWANPEVAYGIAFATAAAKAFKQPFLMEIRSFLKNFSNLSGTHESAEWGQKVGKHIARLRTDDGSEASEVNFYFDRYKRRQDALRWSPTGPYYATKPGPAFPTYARALFPGQGAITPWTMRSGAQFRADEFYDPASPEFAVEFDHIKRLGGKSSSMRTPDQEEIALFWEDGPWGLTPPGHFLLIAIQALQNRPMSFIDTARAFALLGMTQCDASISAWDSKYNYDILRPETAIRNRAHKFRNPDQRVVVDASWQSLIPTPEFPSYTSGHSTFGSAAMTMLRLLRGSDRINLSQEAPDQVIWPQIAGKRRHWTSLSQISEENGLSRIYGGVHWEIDHANGVKAGRAIAHQAFETMFQERG